MACGMTGTVVIGILAIISVVTIVEAEKLGSAIGGVVEEASDIGHLQREKRWIKFPRGLARGKVSTNGKLSSFPFGAYFGRSVGTRYGNYNSGMNGDFSYPSPYEGSDIYGGLDGYGKPGGYGGHGGYGRYGGYGGYGGYDRLRGNLGHGLYGGYGGFSGGHDGGGYKGNCNQGQSSSSGSGGGCGEGSSTASPAALPAYGWRKLATEPS